MTKDLQTVAGQAVAGDRPDDPPMLTGLGTLHELTLGPFDGIGGFAGDEGSVILGAV